MYSSGRNYDASTLSEAATGLTVAAFAMLTLATIVVARRLPGLRSAPHYEELARMQPQEYGDTREEASDIEAIDKTDGEIRRAEVRHLVFVILASLPFIFVRLVNSCLYTYSGDRRYSPLFRDVGIFIGTNVAMEMTVIVLIEGVGLTPTSRKADEKAHEEATNQNKKPWYFHIPIIGLLLRLGAGVFRR